MGAVVRPSVVKQFGTCIVIFLKCMPFFIGLVDPPVIRSERCGNSNEQRDGGNVYQQSAADDCAGLPAETGGAPEPRSEEFYRKRPCPALVCDAARILDEMLSEI